MNKKSLSWLLIVSCCLLTVTGIVSADGPRSINFVGLDWVVKSGCGLGPGPNCWSDSEQSVWLDSDGVHLKMRNIGGQWHSAEIYTTACTDYGMHRFYLIGRVDQLDVNVVAAPFLYQDDLTEIDIEFARWGVPGGDNGHYVVQPGSNPANHHDFLMTLGGTHSTHYFDWQPDSIQFRSIHGHYAEPPNPAFLIDEWLYTGDAIPDNSGCLRVHFNLWQMSGLPPSDGMETEVILADADLPIPTMPTSVSAISAETSPNLLTPLAILLIALLTLATIKLSRQ